MPVAGEGLGKGVMNSAAARREEVRGGEGRRHAEGTSRPLAEGRLGARGGGGWEQAAAEKTRVLVAAAAAEIFGSLTASARALARNLKNFSKWDGWGRHVPLQILFQFPSEIHLIQKS
jgi:hypothetical protein